MCSIHVSWFFTINCGEFAIGCKYMCIIWESDIFCVCTSNRENWDVFVLLDTAQRNNGHIRILPNTSHSYFGLNCSIQ